MSKSRGKYYPKTRRIKDIESRYVVTEKLDGSNIGFGVVDGRLVVFQRSKAYFYEKGAAKDIKGLEGWLQENENVLLDLIDENQVVFGEWLGMGKIKYDLPCRYYIFACGQINKTDDDFEVYNLTNSLNAIDKHCSKLNSVKAYNIGISKVMLVSTEKTVSINTLDELYSDWCMRTSRKVEGFVIFDTITNSVEKYVRFKDGKESKHISK